MTKRTILLLMSVFTVCTLCAQSLKRVFLFDEFQQAEILLKNRSKTQVKANYDVNNRKLFYYQDGQLMELTNMTAIDSIKINGRRFLPYNGHLAEHVQLANQNVLIDWLIKDVHIGNIGAMGQTTQANVSTIRLADFWGSEQDVLANKDRMKSDTEVHKQQTNSTYIINFKDKVQKICSLKQLYKLFPNKKEELQQFIKTNHLDWTNASDALHILEQAFSINQQPQ